MENVNLKRISIDKDTELRYSNYRTFNCEIDVGVLFVTLDYPPVNLLDDIMMNDLNRLCLRLETDRTIKVVVFQSNNSEIWVCHYDTNLLKDMSTKEVSREVVELSDLQKILNRISKLPQATIAKIQGFARGGGHEFALACDMRFADETYKFMQMEVGMGILPCGGGTSRMARQTGLGRALEVVLSARDFDAKEAELYGLINRFIEADKIDKYVDNLARRIAKFPAESIRACKSMVYESIDNPIDEALKAEAYWLYRTTSETPAIKRFIEADKNGIQFDMNNQRNWENLVMEVQDIT